MPAETTPAESVPPATIRVEVVYAQPERSWTSVQELPAGAIASEALSAARFSTLVPGFDASFAGYAIFGRTISATTVLRDGDRVELVRALIADPKQARRKRARGKT